MRGSPACGTAFCSTATPLSCCSTPRRSRPSGARSSQRTARRTAQRSVFAPSTRSPSSPPRHGCCCTPTVAEAACKLPSPTPTLAPSPAGPASSSAARPARTSSPRRNSQRPCAPHSPPAASLLQPAFCWPASTRRRPCRQPCSTPLQPPGRPSRSSTRPPQPPASSWSPRPTSGLNWPPARAGCANASPSSLPRASQSSFPPSRPCAPRSTASSARRSRPNSTRSTRPPAPAHTSSHSAFRWPTRRWSRPHSTFCAGPAVRFPSTASARCCSRLTSPRAARNPQQQPASPTPNFWPAPSSTPLSCANSICSNPRSRSTNSTRWLQRRNRAEV